MANKCAKFYLLNAPISYAWQENVASHQAKKVNEFQLQT